MCERHADPSFDNQFDYRRIRRCFERAGCLTHHVNIDGAFLPMLYAEPMRG